MNEETIKILNFTKRQYQRYSKVGSSLGKNMIGAHYEGLCEANLEVIHYIERQILKLPPEEQTFLRVEIFEVKAKK